MLFSRSTVLFSTVLLATSAAHAAVAQKFTFINPSGWSVGTTGSTSQDWAATKLELDGIEGDPNVAYNDAGAGLATPSLTATTGVASSGGYYSPVGPYTVTATISNHNEILTPGVGTHIIVQAFTSLNGSDGVLGVQITDTAGNIIPTSNLLQASTYGYDAAYPSSFGPTPAQATIYEFWIPDFTGDFKVNLENQVHVSFLELRVDSIVAAPVGDSSPFAVTPVPEPAAMAIAGIGAAGLLLRRRR